MPVADKTLLDNPEFVLIRTMPTTDAIGSSENFDLRAVSKVGHKVGLVIGSLHTSDGHRRNFTLQQFVLHAHLRNLLLQAAVLFGHILHLRDQSGPVAV